MPQPDFSQLFNDPQFMFGVNLLSNARQPGAMANAQQMVLNMQKQKSEAAYQSALTAQAQREADLRRQSLEFEQQMQPQKLQMERMQIEQAQRQQQLQQQLMGAMAKKFGINLGEPGAPAPAAPAEQQVGPGAFTSPVQAPPAAMPAQPAPAPTQMPAPPAAAGPVGKYGTPAAILDNLQHVESGGNPHAINPQSGAMGAYQFMPSTVAMMRNAGHPFNPLDAAQSRDAADHYLQTLVAAHNGDYQKALADYGGFKKKDPSQYVAQILGSGVGSMPAPVTPPLPTSDMNAPQPNNGMDMASLGALAEMAGMKGGTGMIELGKMQQPQSVAAGSYQRDPSTGALSFIQDPYRQADIGIHKQELGLHGQELALHGQELGLRTRETNVREQENARAGARQAYDIGPAGAGVPAAGPAANSPNNAAPAAAPSLPQKALDAVNEKRFDTANTEIQKSFDANKELPAQITAIRRARADIAAGAYAGTTGDWKKQTVKAFTNTFGMAPDPKVVNSEDFDSAMAQLWMKAVKTVDQNPTERQMMSIKDAFGSRSNDPNALQNILRETEGIFTASAQRHNRAVQQYEAKMGPDPYSRYIDIPAAEAPRPAPASASLAAPRVGMVRGGYVFMGGNPADKNAWKPAPGAR